MSITARTRKILWTRAANRCAVCRCKLTRNAEKGDRESVLGSECHIVARRLGGPRGGSPLRGDPDGYGNLILLCPTDHKQVDDQPSTFDADRLRLLKDAHERWVDETLDWRHAAPESLWDAVRTRSEPAMPTGAPDDGARDLVEGLGIFTAMTADLLRAEQLQVYLRSDDGEIMLAYRHDRGDLWFGYAQHDALDVAFATLHDAETVEDHTDVVRSGDGKEESDVSAPEVFYSAARAMLDIAERTGTDEFVMYLRQLSGSLPEIAMAVEYGSVLMAVGRSGTFRQAFSAFDQLADSVEIGDGIRLQMKVMSYSDIFMKSEVGRARVLANLFTAAVAQRSSHVLDGMLVPEKQRQGLWRRLRNRFFEAFLVLWAVDDEATDELRRWVEGNFDPEPDDGFSAILLWTCTDAISEFYKSGKVSPGGLKRLVDEALDAVYDVIDLWRRIDERTAQEEIAKLFIEVPSYWDEPQVRVRIRRLSPVLEKWLHEDEGG